VEGQKATDHCKYVALILDEFCNAGFFFLRYLRKICEWVLYRWICSLAGYSSHPIQTIYLKTLASVKIVGYVKNAMIFRKTQ
jgi:hypothetical protein